MDRPSVLKVFENTTGPATKLVDLRGQNCSGYFALYAKESGAGVTFSYKVGIDGDNLIVPDDPLTTGANGTIGAVTGSGYIPFICPVARVIEIAASAAVDEAHLIFSYG